MEYVKWKCSAFTEKEGIFKCHNIERIIEFNDSWLFVLLFRLMKYFILLNSHVHSLYIVLGNFVFHLLCKNTNQY